LSIKLNCLMEMPPKKNTKTSEPLSEAEISIGLIKKLLDVSKELAKSGYSFLDEVPNLEKIYSGEAITRKLLDPLEVAAELKDVKVEPKDTLEGLIAGSDTLQQLWKGEMYMDHSEDEAIKILTRELEATLRAIKTKSYKTYLKDPPPVEKEKIST